MRKNYFLTIFMALIIAISGYAQGTEGFNHSESSTSYKTITWTGDNGLSWSANDARGDQVITADNKAICVKQTAGKITGPLTEEQQVAGVGAISFTAKNTVSSSDNTKTTTYKIVCGSVTKTVTVPKMGTSATLVTIPEINSYDATTIEITMTGQSGVRVTIDDLSWTAAATAPTDVVALRADEVSYNSADLAGKIGSTGGAEIIEMGFYYSTTENFVDGEGTKVVATTTDDETGEFLEEIENLQASTTYYFKAYATNIAGTTYSQQNSFTTAARPTEPMIVSAPESIEFTETIINSTVTSSFDIEVMNLTGDLTLSISDNSAFSVSPETISQTDGIIAITVTFAPTAYGEQAGTLTISGGGVEPEEVDLSGFGYYIELTSADNIVSNVAKTSIELSWDNVPTADSYEVEIMKQGDIIVAEDFAGCPEGSTNASAHSADIASSLSKYIPNINGNSWKGVAIYQAGEAIKLGTSSAKGSITTPALDLSGNNGDVLVTFDAMAWSSDQTSIYVYINGENKVEVTGLSNSSDYEMENFTVQLTGGTENSTITFEGIQAGKSRFFLDNIEIYSGTSAMTAIEGSPFATTNPTLVVGGLTENTNYVYNIKSIRNADDAEAETGYTLFTTTGLETVEMPTLSHASGFYSENISVEITCGTEGANIWYILDNEGINLYTEPINISVNTVLYAYATKDGMTESDGVVAKYEFWGASIDNQLNSLQKLFVNNGVLNIENAQVGSNYAIFNSIGVMVTNGTMNKSSLEYTLPAKGTYFVKIGNRTSKVVF